MRIVLIHFHNGDGVNLMEQNKAQKLLSRSEVVSYLKLKLNAMGYDISFGQDKELDDSIDTNKYIDLSKNLFENFKEKTRLLSERLNPADNRIQEFINCYLSDVSIDKSLQLPQNTFTLDMPGLAREVSLPLGEHEYHNEIVHSYRIRQGILNNPKHDRRTTKGSFHIVEGGLPVPPDKIEVPKIAFANLLHEACNPPNEYMTLPFTASAHKPIDLFVSLLLRPIVSPEVANIESEKSLEVRFFAPGSLVSNLDFVETIFGNAGEPDLCENDAALDVRHWTGHTGCIILAPHLTRFKKKYLGLPHYDAATERQRKDGMCWKDEEELYNNGTPFKVTCRNDEGIVVTLIGDNYYGYSKKEIKTQISYSANLLGRVEEEHAGGALVFPQRSIQHSFHGPLLLNKFSKKFNKRPTFEQIKAKFSDLMHLQEENYGIDKQYSNIIYIPDNAIIEVYEGRIHWEYNGKTEEIKLSLDQHYVFPTGHKLKLEKHPAAENWRLIITAAEGVVLHKPFTVSGGGKSEISKTIENAISYGPLYVNNVKDDFDQADEIVERDYANRWKEHPERTKPSRPLMSSERTLGSVVKLLSPSDRYTDEYNEFLNSTPPQVKMLVRYEKMFMFFREDLHTNWRDYVSVNKVNGKEGHELQFYGRKVMASYVRVGFNDDESWCMHTLRPDFMPSTKIQFEDDITASITLPREMLTDTLPEVKNKSLKLVTNCESHFFQRPDDAIVRGYDKRAEEDLSLPQTFITNYEPLTTETAQELIEDAIQFDQYTKPIQYMIRHFVEEKKDKYFIAPSHPRIVDGKPTKNPRYLQKPTSINDPIDKHLGEVGVRFSRGIDLDRPVYYPVNAMLPSRRNNPIDREAGIRPLSVFNPLHYQEMPELFMDFICSLTGKSPSTTGAGSEGALTKGPFNMLTPTSDLNNALLSCIMAEYDGFSSAAGYIGNIKFDHDISILIPEIWCRLSTAEKNPKEMIEQGLLEKIDDFEYNGQKVLASRLGYRITRMFLFAYMNRMFDEPQAVFTEEMLKPELQDTEAFVDGINNIVEAQKKVALNYFEDESVASAIPPLKILLYIMAYGDYEGKTIEDPELRKEFDRDTIINSDWYKERLKLQQERDVARCQNQIEYVEEFMKEDINASVVEKLNLAQRAEEAKKKLARLESQEYFESLVGTIGADPLFYG